DGSADAALRVVTLAASHGVAEQRPTAPPAVVNGARRRVERKLAAHVESKSRGNGAAHHDPDVRPHAIRRRLVTSERPPAAKRPAALGPNAASSARLEDRRVGRTV